MKTKFSLSQNELQKIITKYPTPFYLYDEKAIVENIQALHEAFSWNKGFREYFAVKATPNPFILDLFRSQHCGVDCSSETELILANSCGFQRSEIMFTSNVTTATEFKTAKRLNAIINLDDYSHIDYLEEQAGLPELICFRLNPGSVITYEDKTILNHTNSKFGFTLEQLVDGILKLKKKGVSRFGIHTQFGCHQRNSDYFGENASLIFEKIVEISHKADVTFEFINLAGGIGIPYHEEEANTNINEISEAIRLAYEKTIGIAFSTQIPIYLELGIFMTGPYGYFISSVLHVKNTYKTFLGLDASTNAFMTPCRYSNYHAITVVGKETNECNNTYDVTGALCENRDMFAIDKALPLMETGDILIFHDAGAYSYSHSNNFNGKLRPAELLLRQDGTIRQIRRAQEPSDYFSTLDYPIIYSEWLS
jgi:diaminopimelate decarboxylase